RGAVPEGFGEAWRSGTAHGYLARGGEAVPWRDRPGRGVRWSGAMLWGLVGSGAQALARPDRQVETVLGRREWTGPAWIDRTRRLDRKVEVDDEGAPRRIATEVGALGRIDQVAAGGIRLLAV